MHIIIFFILSDAIFETKNLLIKLNLKIKRTQALNLGLLSVVDTLYECNISCGILFESKLHNKYIPAYKLQIEDAEFSVANENGDLN